MFERKEEYRYSTISEPEAIDLHELELEQSSTRSPPRNSIPGLAYNAALVAFQQRNLELASKQLHEILASNDEFAQAHCLLGEVFYMQNHFPQAILSLQTSLALDHSNATAHLILGKIRFAQKNFYLASEHLASASRIDPKNAETQLLIGETHKLMAHISKEFGKQHEVDESFLVADRAYQNALDLNPDDRVSREAQQNLHYEHERLSIEEVFAAQKGDIWTTIVALDISNNLELVKKVIKAKVGEHPFKPYGNKVNGRNAEGWTPLNVCAGSMVLVKLLVEEYRADISVLGKDRGSALTVAASLGKHEIIEYLVSRGTSLGSLNDKGDNILHICTREHTPEENASRSLMATIKTVFAILRRQDQVVRVQDQATFQVSLIENASKGTPAGTTLLLRLLTQRNKYKQTVIELADSLTKFDLVGLFREELALLINERLGGLVNNLFVPTQNNMLQPIVCNNPKKIIALAALYNTFLTTHLNVLSGSFLCSSAPTYARFSTLESIGASLISLTPGQAKKAGITEEHVNAAHAVHSIIETILGHGVTGTSILDSLATTQLTEVVRAALPRNTNTTHLSASQREASNQYDMASLIAEYAVERSATPPFLNITPQAIITRLKHCIFATYQSLFSCKVKAYCQGGSIEDGEENFASIHANIMDTILRDFKAPAFAGNSRNIRAKVVKFCQQLNKEIIDFTTQIKKGLQADDGEDEISLIMRKLNALYNDNKLMNLGIPSFKLLTEIFEELTGIQVQVKSSNFGWVATIEKTRKEQAAAQSQSSAANL